MNDVLKVDLLTETDVSARAEPRATLRHGRWFGPKVAFFAIGIPVIAWFLRYAAEMFIPIVLAILIAYALDPIVTVLCKWHIPRSAAAFIVLLAIVGGSGGSLYFLRQHFIAVIEGLPDTARGIRHTLESGLSTSGGASPIKKINEAASEIEKATNAAGDAPAPSARAIPPASARFRVQDYLWRGSLGIAGMATEVGVILFLVYFLLASGDLYKRKLVRIIGTDFSEKRVTVEMLHEIDRQIERFLVIQILISVFVGAATGIGLALLGVAQPVVWGLVAGVLNFIPYFGAIIAAGGLGLIAFGQFGTMGGAAAVAGMTLFVRVIEGGIATPVLMGRTAKINGVAVFVSLLFWGWLWGVIGMLVAVPITMIVKTACERIDGLGGVGELLNEK